MKTFLRIFSRRWILTTLLVIAAMGVLIRLGIWQLDRLEKRRAFNARVTTQVDRAPLILDANAIDDDLVNMEYRQVTIAGEYDHPQEIAIRNQYWDNQWGVHLITPLHIEDTNQTVLVDRGWIPAQDFQSGDWSAFNEPGRVEVFGVIRSSRDKADLGSRVEPTLLPGEGRREAWYFVNIELISGQIAAPLLPIYIQQAPDPAWTKLPYRSQPKLEITEGPHMSYAIQWFTFAAVLGLGYPFFVRRQEKRLAEKRQSSQERAESRPVTTPP